MPFALWLGVSYSMVQGAAGVPPSLKSPAFYVLCSGIIIFHEYALSIPLFLRQADVEEQAGRRHCGRAWISNTLDGCFLKWKLFVKLPPCCPSHPGFLDLGACTKGWILPLCLPSKHVAASSCVTFNSSALFQRVEHLPPLGE